MGLCTILNNRLPPLCCAILATASLLLSIGSSTTCQFLNISYPAHTPDEEGYIIADESLFNNIGIDKDSDFDKHHVGVFCESEYFNRDRDLMWIITRYSIIIGFILLGISLLYALGLSTFVKPTYTSWKILSVASIVTAGIQIPSFLFYTIQPCQTNQAQCSAGPGFFMLLWSIILMTTITIVTQCFNYPAWREESERWKIQERAYPMYDPNQEDTFDIEEEQNYNLEGITGHMMRNANGNAIGNSPLREQGRVSARNENKVTFPTQELNTHRLLRKKGKKTKSKDKDGAFNFMHGNGHGHGQGDDKQIDMASQCLSGMSAEIPSVNHIHNRNGLASLLKEEAININTRSYDDDDDNNTDDEESEMVIFADEEKMDMELEHFMQDNDIHYNEEWGEVARRKDDELGLSVSNSSPFRSPPRRRMKKKGKENVSYVGLDDGYDDDDVNDDDGDHESQDLEYGNDHASRQHNYTLRNDIDSFHHDPDESDIESMNSSHVGKQLHVVDLATGTRELIVENYKKSTHTRSQTKTKTEPKESLLPPMVSDDEEEDPDLSFEAAEEDFDVDGGSRGILDDLENGHGEKRTNSNHYQPSTKSTDGALTETEDEETEDEDVSSPSDKHLANLLAKFTAIDSKYKSRDVDIDSEKSSEWHDVLDAYDEDEPREHLIQNRSEDFDDEKDHVEMMRTLRQTRSVGMDLSPITRHKNSPVNQQTSSTGTRTAFVSRVVVSDNEDEVSSLGQRGSARYLYPDEVEV